MRNNTEATKAITLHLPESIIADLDQIAKIEMRTRSGVARKILTQAVEDIGAREGVELS